MRAQLRPALVVLLMLTALPILAAEPMADKKLIEFGWDEPDTAFSAAGTTAVTATGSSERAAASRVASTAAPPAMSVFISRMPALGLIDNPPVSNVMPLPTRTGCPLPAAGWR